MGCALKQLRREESGEESKRDVQVIFYAHEVTKYGWAVKGGGERERESIRNKVWAQRENRKEEEERRRAESGNEGGSTIIGMHASNSMSASGRALRPC